jgi:ATP-dependent helicase/nuclease subunit A
MTVNAELLSGDQQARRDALDISRSFIVQAPAGSGKTELLIQRYLNLLGSVDNPEEVLAITFTRKAAAEMQLRVIQALELAETGVQPLEDHERITFDLARSVLSRDQELSWNLVANPRRMRVQTVDSLNASIARSQPLTAIGGARGGAILADAEMNSLYRNAATLTLDQLAESGPLHDATRQVLAHVDNSTWLYIAYLVGMLRTRDQWLPFIGGGLGSDDDIAALRGAFESSLQSIVTRHLQQVREAFPKDVVTELLGLTTYAALELEAAGKGGGATSSLMDIGGLPSSDDNAVVQWGALAEFLLTKGGSWRKTVNKNQGFPPGDDGQKAAMLDLLESLREQEHCRILLQGVRLLPPIRYSDEQWQVLVALFQLLPLAVTELKRLFSERNVTDHIEIALCAGSALGSADAPGDMALLLDYRLRHLLVDEMQDTSSAQYRMLEALTGGWQEGDGRTLFCVGDPMQSIYRFRNAEVGQFLLARKSGIGEVSLESLILRRNFRSGEHLVNWFNDVFPAVLPLHDDPAQGAVSYSAAVPVPKLVGQGSCVVHPLFGSSKSVEADTGRQVVQQVLDASPDDDVAILVRGRTQLPLLLAQLRQAGVPYKAVEIDRLTDLPEIIDILALTRALVHLGDRLAWLALLRSPWVGLDWTDLHALVVGDSRSTVWELINDEERLIGLSETGRHSVLAARQALALLIVAGRVETLRDRVERGWMVLGGPALLADHGQVENIYRYLDVLEKIEVAGSLTDVAELESILDQERVSSDSNARVQVMTMHRAKGLQFDHVVLFGLGRVPGSSERKVLSWIDIPGKHGDEEKVMSPVGPRAELENDPLHRYIELTQSAKDRHEQGRLLYVACTRARKSLHLIGHVELNKDATEFRPATSRSLLSLLWSSISIEFDKSFDAQPCFGKDDDINSLQKPVLRRLKSAWTLPTPTPLPGMVGDAQETVEGRKVEFYWVGAAARLAGTLVHRWLQMATEHKAQLEAGRLEKLRPITARWLREMGVNDDSAPQISERVETALHSILQDEKGRWILTGTGYAELRLSGVISDLVESVILDRVRVDADGTHWIIDYKTSTHEGGNLTAFLQAESDRYRPQLAKYATLYREYSGADVRCALYFPLLQHFMEVTV